ncbi:MAG: ArgE/DapE family deacylase [Acidobacteriota bacterium]|nr:ArgE/DapE family deacylase [Acidobacteriota bacterium]MDQ7088391.1 ArgE/DapE family deacylase [Acidobacteriota bacterium]
MTCGRYAAALAALERDWSGQVALLQEMVRIPSVVGDEGKVQRWVRERFAALGLDVQEILLGEERLAAHPTAFDTGFPGAGRPNFRGRWAGTGDGPSLVLNAHVDVVPVEPVDAWSVDPWGGEIRGGRLYGRGAADMKGGWIAIHAALAALRASGYRPPGDLYFESVVEEEAGGVHGTLACRLEPIPADGMIITEPLWTHVIVAHPGILYFRLRVEGRSTHAALAQHGVSALLEALPIVAALEALDRSRARAHRHPLFERLPGCQGRSVHLNLGVCRAGDWPSTVPAEAVIEARVSYLPGESEAAVRDEILETVRAAASTPWLVEHPPEVEWFGWRGQPWQQDPAHRLVGLLQQAVGAERGSVPEVAADTAGLDARWAGEFGIPCAVFGPYGEQIHGVDEWVDLDSIRVVARSLLRTIIDWQHPR